MIKWEQLKEDIFKLSEEERQKIIKIITFSEGREEILIPVAKLVHARVTEMAKKESDRKTDHQRRILIGARLRREEAERYRQAARCQGKSLYSWVKNALRQQLKTECNCKDEKQGV